MSLESPQLEDGFTPIANGIMDALARTRFSGYERSVLDFLFRKTYGWSKKSDLIALSQFVDATRIAKPHVVRTIKKLVDRNVILRTVAQTGNATLVRYEFNKHWGEWTTLPKSVTAHSSLPKMVIEPLPKQAPTISIKDTTSKRLEDSVVTQKRMNRKVPLLTFDPPTQSVVGELEEAKQRFAAAFPKSDFDTSMETMRVWIVKKGNPHKTYWKSLCTFASGEVAMKKFSVGEVGKSNMGEEWG
jgi:phage replication O-like protein O